MIQFNIMSLLYTGYKRSLVVEVYKNGVQTTNSPYNGQLPFHAISGQIYDLLTDEQFEILPTADYLQRLQDFQAYVSLLEPGISFTLDVPGTYASKIAGSNCTTTTTSTTTTTTTTTSTTTTTTSSTTSTTSTSSSSTTTTSSSEGGTTTTTTSTTTTTTTTTSTSTTTTTTTSTTTTTTTTTTSSSTTTTTTTCNPSAYSYPLGFGTSKATACANYSGSPITVYALLSSFGTGMILYLDCSLATPVTGYTHVVNGSDAFFMINDNEVGTSDGTCV